MTLPAGLLRAMADEIRDEQARQRRAEARRRARGR